MEFIVDQPTILYSLERNPDYIVAYISPLKRYKLRDILKDSPSFNINYSNYWIVPKECVTMAILKLGNDCLNRMDGDDVAGLLGRNLKLLPIHPVSDMFGGKVDELFERRCEEFFGRKTLSLSV